MTHMLFASLQSHGVEGCMLIDYEEICSSLPRIGPTLSGRAWVPKTVACSSQCYSNTPTEPHDLDAGGLSCWEGQTEFPNALPKPLPMSQMTIYQPGRCCAY